MKVMIIGDVHGNIDWLRDYVFPAARTAGAHAIVQAGDFGAWEHTRSGYEFFNDVDELGSATGIPLYWLHGTHDKFSPPLAHYGGTRDQKGFVVCRESVFYIPQGLSWTWSGVSLR